MLYRFSFKQKIGLLSILYLLIAVIGYSIVEVSLSLTNTYYLIALNFIQSWNIILVGFLFFQAFKYFRLPLKYYSRKKLDSSFIYKILGVPLFRLVLINSFFRHLNKRVYLKGKSKDYVQVFIEETKQSETSHLISMICTLAIQLHYLKHDDSLYNFLFLTIFSVTFNLYPMLLQRMNRFKMMDKYPNLLKQEKN